jgi:hypothetical protein
MKAISRTLLVVTLALVSTFAWPKSQTIKLAIVGPGLIEPLEITDRAVLDRFSIWKDGEVYQRNVFSIVHGVEGNWFYASPAWERSVRPLIQQLVAR